MPPPTADAYRLAGNASFTKKDYDNCLLMYTMAVEAAGGDSSGCAPLDVELPPTPASTTLPPAPPSGGGTDPAPVTPLSTHYCNRSLVYSTMCRFVEAIADAKECVRLTGGANVKGYFRLIKALCGKQLYGEAIEYLETAIVQRPKITYTTDPATGASVEGPTPDHINQEREELEKLKGNVQKHKKVHDKKVLNGDYEFDIKCVKTDGRKPMVREFDFTKELGTGNFSRIVSAQHKKTGELFAIKVIEKKQVENLQRRHPNVHNEIQMEKKLLAKVKHESIVTLYHTFQDYNALYFLMELCEGAEMWTTIMFGAKLVGCHESLSRFYMSELVEVMEYLHKEGIVHRDLKPENLMIQANGHLKVIDFGTAKDLVDESLNGPEFVGTPEFMSPECVKSKKSGPETDLWSFGVVLWQMLLGTTPFKAPSPYLGFLKIKRGQIVRHPALSDEAWDLISRLLVVDPAKRIGANMDYKTLRAHPYFQDMLGETETPLYKKPAERVPTLADLCLRAVGELAVDSSLDLEADEPGAGGPSDMLRMNARDKNRVMHFLDRMEKLSEPRVLRRFYRTNVEAKFGRVRPMTRDFLGLTSERQNQFTEAIDFVHIGETDSIELLKTIVRVINRKRPKFVVITGKVSEEAKMIIAKISETISFILADGSDFYTFYCGGCQGIVVNGELIIDPSVDPEKSAEQSKFISQELEQSRMCQHHTFVFTDVDTRRLPEAFTEKVAKSRVCAILGPSGQSGIDDDYDGEYIVGRGMKNEKEEKKDVKMREEGVYPDEEEDREGSDVDSDGYNMVDDDSRVKVLARGFSTVFSLGDERQWKAFSLPVA